MSTHVLLLLSPPPPFTHTHTHIHAHTRTHIHARMHAHISKKTNKKHVCQVRELPQATPVFVVLVLGISSAN